MTVSALKKQLEILENLGMGEASVVYRTEEDLDLPVTTGVWDNSTDWVALA